MSHSTRQFTKAICIQAWKAKLLGAALQEPEIRNQYGSSPTKKDDRRPTYITIIGKGMPPTSFSMLQPYISRLPGMATPINGTQLRSRSSGTRTPRILIHFLTVWSAHHPPIKLPDCGQFHSSSAINVNFWLPVIYPRPGAR